MRTMSGTVATNSARCTSFAAAAPPKAKAWRKSISMPCGTIS